MGVEFPQTDSSRDAPCVLPTFHVANGPIQKLSCQWTETTKTLGCLPTESASIQDRLRERQPHAMGRFVEFPCVSIKALDSDVIRTGKATQVNISVAAVWSIGAKECIAEAEKANLRLWTEAPPVPIHVSSRRLRPWNRTRAQHRMWSYSRSTTPSIFFDVPINGPDPVAFP